MAYHINVPAAQAQLTLLGEKYAELAPIFNSINTDYIDATKEVWGTPKGANYIQSIVTSLNEMINEFNSKVPSSVTETVEQINPFLTSEEMTTLTDPGLAPIPNVEKGWEGNPDETPVPTEFGELTASAYTANMTKVSEIFGELSGIMDTLVSTGFDSAFLNNAKESFEKNKGVVEEMVSQNTQASATNAAAEDTNVSSAAAN